MRTFTAQFRLSGNFGIEQIDPDSTMHQNQLSQAIVSNFVLGKVQLTNVEEFVDALDRHDDKSDSSTEWSTIVDINLYLNESVGKNFRKHQATITQKAVETLNNSKMFLSYLWQQKNTAHIGLETIFV